MKMRIKSLHESGFAGTGHTNTNNSSWCHLAFWFYFRTFAFLIRLMIFAVHQYLLFGSYFWDTTSGAYILRDHMETEQFNNCIFVIIEYFLVSRMIIGKQNPHLCRIALSEYGS